MDAPTGLTLSPNPCATAGSRGRAGMPVNIPPQSFRPNASDPAFSTMLALLETLRNQAVSGCEPASFLIAELESNRTVLVAGASDADLRSLEARHGRPRAAWAVSARDTAAGCWLTVRDATGRCGYHLEQFCCRHAGERIEPLPHFWIPVAPRLPGWTPGLAR